MNRHFYKLVSIVSTFFFLFALSTVTSARASTHDDFKQLDSNRHAVIAKNVATLQNEDSGDINMHIITNPTIVSDSRELHQLSTDTLAADTATLLHAVLNSDYIRIARDSARLLSSSFEPLTVHYSYFNGFAELLTRDDLASTLLSYIRIATPYELEILREILLRDDVQTNLNSSAADIITSLNSVCNQFMYESRTNSSWSDIADGTGVNYSLIGTVSFYGGEQINAYQASREYTETEASERDARTASLNLPITLIHSADASYNCHSYAWYHMSNSNPYWIGVRDIGDEGFVLGDQMFIPSSAFIVDEEYQEMDIVVYYDESQKILHSAVIIDVNGDNITLQSKWGGYGVYRHNLNAVPVDYLGSDGYLRYQVYRYHIYTRTTIDLGHSLRSHTYKHTDTCTICGHTVTSTVQLSCSGPPCAVPLSWRSENE